MTEENRSVRDPFASDAIRTTRRYPAECLFHELQTSISHGNRIGVATQARAVQAPVASRAGMVKKKVDPFPGLDSTQIRPP